MSVTAHLTEQFVLKREFPALNFKWLLLGAYLPDGFGIDRLFMFGIDVGFHRDFGFGWLHTPIAPILIALPVYFLFGRWAFWSFLISMELHVLTDVMDSLGVMLLWPFDNTRFALGWMPWHDTGVITDLIRYYCNPIALIFELAFLIGAIFVINRANRNSFMIGLIQFWQSDPWRSIRHKPNTYTDGRMVDERGRTIITR